MAKEREHSQKKQKSSKGGLGWLKVILSVLLVLEILYCVAIFSNIPFIAHLRDMYIQTAMSTMSHQWLAKYFIPKDIIDDVMRGFQDAKDHQMELNSDWESGDANGGQQSHINANNQMFTQPVIEGHVFTEEETAFFDLFWEIDRQSMLDYVEANPSVTSNGWDNIYINEAGLDDDGTSIKTIMGEQILAIDASNEVLLIRVTGSTYRGILAVAKDPSRLRLAAAEHIGSYGEHAGSIAERNDAILAITGSGFVDEGGGGNGGELAGACMCEGVAYGSHFGWGYKRIELHENDRLYIRNAESSFGDDTTDASEFWPALVVNGENALGADNIFIEMNPRACLGQSSTGEILMLVIEGRLVGTSLGTDAEECTDILLRHDAYQAMNLDGGTSAIMWYDGEYVTRCSNTVLDYGRYLPNAWIY